MHNSKTRTNMNTVRTSLTSRYFFCCFFSFSFTIFRGQGGGTTWRCVTSHVTNARGTYLLCRCPLWIILLACLLLSPQIILFNYLGSSMCVIMHWHNLLTFLKHLCPNLGQILSRFSLANLSPIRVLMMPNPAIFNHTAKDTLFVSCSSDYSNECCF